MSIVPDAIKDQAWGKAGVFLAGGLALATFLVPNLSAVITGKYTDQQVAKVAHDVALIRDSVRDIRALLVRQEEEDKRLRDRLDGQARHGANQDDKINVLELEVKVAGWRLTALESLRDRTLHVPMPTPERDL